MIGQDFDGKADKEDFNTGFDPRQGFSGKVSQVEIWNKILTLVEIQKLSNCYVSTTKFQNRVLTWRVENWKLSGQTRFHEIPLKDLCQKNIISNQFIWPSAIDFDKFSSYCNLIDGIPPLVHKNSQKEEVYNKVKQIFLLVNKTFPSGFQDKRRTDGIRCFVSKTSSDMNFWTGMKWNQIEGKWYSPFKPSMDFSDFKEEIVDENVNCGYIYANTFYNSGCQRKFPCGICEVRYDKVITLKGLCQYGYDLFDLKYYIYGLKNNRPYFK